MRRALFAVAAAITSNLRTPTELALRTRRAHNRARISPLEASGTSWSVTSPQWPRWHSSMHAQRAIALTATQLLCACLAYGYGPKRERTDGPDAPKSPSNSGDAASPHDDPTAARDASAVAGEVDGGATPDAATSCADRGQCPPTCSDGSKPGPCGCSFDASCVNSGCTVAAAPSGHEYLFCQFKLSWSAARAECQRLGADMVIINDSEENAWLNANLPTTAMGVDVRTWVGLSDRSAEGKWRWITPGGGEAGALIGSSAAPYAAWASNQPDDAGRNQDCAGFNETRGLWDDFFCDALQLYICETY